MRLPSTERRRGMTAPFPGLPGHLRPLHYVKPTPLRRGHLIKENNMPNENQTTETKTPAELIAEMRAKIESLKNKDKNNDKNNDKKGE